MPPLDASTDVNAVLDRLESSFGHAPLRDLLDRFAVQLDEALAALDRGEARAIAHRVAGMAGTLGFAALGRAWLPLADGDTSRTDDARTETLAGLAIIVERRQSAG